MKATSPYRLEVVYDEPEAKPEPARVSCDDCRWYGGGESLGAMFRQSCLLFSNNPSLLGDSKLAALRDDDLDRWIALRKQWNFNKNGDCFGFAHWSLLVRAHRHLLVRLWKKLTG